MVYFYYFVMRAGKHSCGHGIQQQSVSWVYLTVNTEHVQSGYAWIGAVEVLFEYEQDAGLQRSVVFWQKQ